MNTGADLHSLPILDNPDNFVVNAYAAFILEFSYVAINNLPQLNSSRSDSIRSIQSNVCLSFVCQIIGSLSTWYHKSQELLVMKYRMLSSLNIDVISVSFLSSSVYFSRAPDKNYWRSSMVYHLFVNGATFSLGTRLFSNGSAKHGCVGAHGVGWLFLCVCVGLLACRGTWVSTA